jgi:uncharacterized protein
MTALRIDVADLLARPAARREVRLSALVEGLAGSAAGVSGPVGLDLVLERVSDGLVVRGTLTTAWSAQCSVCLADLGAPLSLAVGELFEREPLEGDTYPIDGHQIDLDQLVRDAILLELPLAPTCADTGAPPCAVASEPPAPGPRADPEPADPRWAALSELEL